MREILLLEPLHLRSWLRDLRRRRGWTQAELGRRLGLGQARIAEIEKSPELISVQQLLQIVSTLGGMLGGSTADANSAPAGPAYTAVHEPAAGDGPRKAAGKRPRGEW